MLRYPKRRTSRPPFRYRSSQCATTKRCSHPCAAVCRKKSKRFVSARDCNWVKNDGFDTCDHTQAKNWPTHASNPLHPCKDRIASPESPYIFWQLSLLGVYDSFVTAFGFRLVDADVKCSFLVHCRPIWSFCSWSKNSCLSWYQASPGTQSTSKIDSPRLNRKQDFSMNRMWMAPLCFWSQWRKKFLRWCASDFVWDVPRIFDWQFQKNPWWEGISIGRLLVHESLLDTGRFEKIGVGNHSNGRMYSHTYPSPTGARHDTIPNNSQGLPMAIQVSGYDVGNGQSSGLPCIGTCPHGRNRTIRSSVPRHPTDSLEAVRFQCSMPYNNRTPFQLGHYHHPNSHLTGSVGSVPINAFVLTSSPINAFNWTNSVGSVPIKPLSDKSANWRAGSRPSSVGNVPDKEFSFQ